MHGRWVALAAANALIAVGAGAFGAHALQDRLDLERRMIFEVAARYQMYHALALFVIAFVSAAGPARLARASGICMVAGIVLFSGSLYALSLTGLSKLGAVTPIGGSLFMVGWLLLAFAGLRAGGRTSDDFAHSSPRSAARERLQ